MPIEESQRAPWTDEQVENLKKWQVHPFAHPFTCCSHDDCDRLNQPNEGALIPSNEGWVCPCGKWKQNWAHQFMLDGNLPKDPFAEFRNKTE